MGTKSVWASVIIALAGLGTAMFTFLDNRGSKPRVKGELAAQGVMAARLAERVSRIEGWREAHRDNCACVPRGESLELVEEGPPLPEEFTSEPWEEDLDPAIPRILMQIKPKMSAPEVQQQVEAYDW